MLIDNSSFSSSPSFWQSPVFYVTFSLSIHLSIGILVVSTESSAAMNKKVQISLRDHDFNPFVEIPRNRIAGPYLDIYLIQFITLSTMYKVNQWSY